MKNSSARLWLAVAFMAYFCLTLYWMLSFTGPVPWIVRRQLSDSNFYSMMWTILILQSPVLIPLLLLGRAYDFDPRSIIVDSLGRWPFFQDLFGPAIILGVGNRHRRLRMA